MPESTDSGSCVPIENQVDCYETCVSNGGLLNTPEEFITMACDGTTFVTAAPTELPAPAPAPEPETPKPTDPPSSSAPAQNTFQDFMISSVLAAVAVANLF